MSGDIGVGDTVEWSGARGGGEGTVEERHTRRVSRTVDGNDVSRDASNTDPAYVVEGGDGDRVLKSDGEVDAVGD